MSTINGDTVTGVENDPIEDAPGSILNERNQCLVLHLEAGIGLMNKGVPTCQLWQWSMGWRG